MTARVDHEITKRERVTDLDPQVVGEPIVHKHFVVPHVDWRGWQSRGGDHRIRRGMFATLEEVGEVSQDTSGVGIALGDLLIMSRLLCSTHPRGGNNGSIQKYARSGDFNR